MSDISPDEAALLTQMDAGIGILVLVRGALKDGAAHYAYVSVPPSRYPAFKQAEAAGNYDLAAFGKILAHGPGREPPLDVQRRMVEEYGVDHRFEEELAEWLEQWQRIAGAAGG